MSDAPLSAQTNPFAPAAIMNESRGASPADTLVNVAKRAADAEAERDRLTAAIEQHRLSIIEWTDKSGTSFDDLAAIERALWKAARCS